MTILAGPASSLSEEYTPAVTGGQKVVTAQLQTDPKKKEITATISRSAENETVSLKAQFPEDMSGVRVTLYNLLGRLIEVHPTTSVPKGEYDFRFLTRGLPNGPYIIILETSGQRIINKVMLSR